MTGFDAIRRMLKLRVGNQNIVELDTASTLNLRANQFYLEDPTDITKKMQFDISGLPTATTLTVAGNRRTIVDTGGAFATPIVLTTADSGNVYLLDDAAGLDFTLPALTAAEKGIFYGFRVMTTNTSNSYRLTAQTGDIIHGHVLTSDFDAAYTAPQILAAEGGGATLVMTMAAIAQGGGAGGWFEIEAISATAWFVHGSLIGDGTITTPFS